MAKQARAELCFQYLVFAEVDERVRRTTGQLPSRVSVKPSAAKDSEFRRLTASTIVASRLAAYLVVSSDGYLSFGKGVCQDKLAVG
jgi:hypothetical protein